MINCENCNEGCNNKNIDTIDIKRNELPLIVGGFLNLTQRCNLKCKYCTPKGTKILMSDFSYKNVEDIKIGDKVIGFDEFQTQGKHRKLYITTVEQLHQHKDELIRITLEDDTYIDITKNHPIFNNRANYNNGWKNAGDYKIGQTIKCFSGVEYKNIDSNNINYKIGYFISMMLGDGSLKKYDYSDRFFTINGKKRKGQDKYFRVRLAVKDDEIIDRIEQYSKDFNIDWNKRKFLISSYNGDVYKDALFSEREDVYDKINNLIEENLLKNNTYEYHCGFLAGIYDAEGNFREQGGIIRICNFDKSILKTIVNGLSILNINYAIEKNKNIINKQTYTIRLINGFHKYDNLKFILSIKNAVKRKGVNNFYNRLELYSKKIKGIESIGEDYVYNIGTTSRTYIANNIGVHNCFVVQQPKEMTFQVAKDSADFFAKNAKLSNQTPSINYFGGEPLLKWNDIIVPLTLYIRERYGVNFRLGLTTNGILLDEEKLEFMKKYDISFLFSIDGDKKTQDLNRPYHNGKGSFDDLINKIPMFLKYNPNATFRSTIDFDNVSDMADNYKFAIKMGYNNIFMIPNVFVEWNDEQRFEMKKQLHEIADIYIENKRNDKEIQFNQFTEAQRKIDNINTLKGTNRYRDISEKFPAYGRCGLGGNRFASIGMSGKLYSCQELVENPELGDYFEIGNIYDGVDEKKRWDIINKFNPKNIIRNDGKTCRDCSMNQICNGGCLINNYLATGDLEIMPSILCEFYQECINQQLRITEELSRKVTKIIGYI